MAIFERLRSHRTPPAIVREEMAEKRERLVGQYGGHLGEALFDYVYMSAYYTDEELAKSRRRFATTVVLSLFPTTDDRNVDGLEALLEVFEAKLAPVARQAADAETPIG